MAKQQRLVDHSRTTLPYAGQWLKNSRELLGLFLLAAGTVGVPVCLAALAHKETKSAIGAGIEAGLALTGGTVWLLVEARRIHRIGAQRPDDQDHQRTLTSAENPSGDGTNRPAEVDEGPIRPSGFPLE